MIDDAEFDQFEDNAPRKAPAKKAPAKKAAPRKAAPRKRVPATAKQPQDHKPKAAQSGAKARQLEASGDEFVILEQCGVEFKIPADRNEWPLSAVDYLSQGHELSGIKEILGVEQWAALVKTGAKLKDLNELGQKFSKAFGFAELGN